MSWAVQRQESMITSLLLTALRVGLCGVVGCAAPEEHDNLCVAACVGLRGVVGRAALGEHDNLCVAEQDSVVSWAVQRQESMITSVLLCV